MNWKRVYWVASVIFMTLGGVWAFIIHDLQRGLFDVAFAIGIYLIFVIPGEV